MRADLCNRTKLPHTLYKLIVTLIVCYGVPSRIMLHESQRKCNAFECRILRYCAGFCYNWSTIKYKPMPKCTGEQRQILLKKRLFEKNGKSTKSIYKVYIPTGPHNPTGCIFKALPNFQHQHRTLLFFPFLILSAW